MPKDVGLPACSNLRFDTSSRKLSHPQLDAGQRDGTGAIEIDQFAGTERFEELTLYPYLWLSKALWITYLSLLCEGTFVRLFTQNIPGF